MGFVLFQGDCLVGVFSGFSFADSGSSKRIIFPLHYVLLRPLATIKVIYLFDLKKTVCSLDPVLSRAGCSGHQHPGVAGATCHLLAVASEPMPVCSLDTAGLEVVFAAC